MLHAATTWRSGAVEVVLPPSRAVTILEGRPIFNDASIRFETSATTPHSLARATETLRVRNERMQGDPLRALIDFGCDVEVVAVHAHHAPVRARDDIVVGWGDGVCPQPQTGGFGAFVGDGQIVVRTGRELGRIDVDSRRTIQLAVHALRAWQGDLRFETEACGAIYRVSGEGCVWWGV
jgi:uncharacterized protein (AIM24 family)